MDKNTYCERLYDRLTRLCGKIAGKTICVCLSGGADSSALLAAMQLIAEEKDVKLFAAHLNHTLRGEESERDQHFCETLCNQRSVRLFTARENVATIAAKKGISIEMAAREARYRFFDRLRTEESIDFFVTAHTAEDHTETVFLNLIRGCTVAGLRGIPQINGTILRPLIGFTRADNLQLLSDLGLSYVEDSTNADDIFKRNFLRHNLLPNARKLNARLDAAIARLSIYAGEDEDYLEREAAKFLPHQPLSDLHPALLRRVIRRCYQNASGGSSLLSAHIDAIASCILTGKDDRIALPGKLIAEIRAGCLRIKPDLPQTFFRDNGLYKLHDGENSFADGRVRIYCASGTTQNVYKADTVVSLSSGKIKGDLYYRARQPGDKIHCRGMHRLIKKELAATGLPLEIRQTIPVFCDQKGIVFVPFIGAADRVFAKNQEEAVTTLFVRFKSL